MKSEFGDLYKVHVKPEWLSRGTGEQVPLQEATAFDFMPQLIGARFMTKESLQKRIHFYGECINVPFLMLEEGYGQLAKEELSKGNLDEALDAYKRGFHYSLQWIQGGARIQEICLYKPSELERMNIGSKVRDVEEGLINAIVSQDISFNPEKYGEFVKKIRRLEKRQLQLNQLFYGGRSTAYGQQIDAPSVHDPKIGREYIENSLEMGMFSQAAWVAKRLGLADEETKYKKLEETTEPKDGPRVQALISGLRERHETEQWLKHSLL